MPGLTIDALYAGYFAILANICMKMARERGEAEELAQEAFLKALSDPVFPELSDAQQRAWLNRTARRLFIDRARRCAHAPQPEAPLFDEPDLTALQVAEALSQLSPEQHELVALRYFAGYSSKELGEHFGLSPATVRTRLRAAAKILKKHYL